MGHESGPVAGIVLAAGRGSRLGTTKQLLPLEGIPLLAHAVRAAEGSSLGDVIVVLGHDADAIAASLPLHRARIIYNPRYLEGQSTSLQAGLLAVGPRVQAAMVLLGDQPGVSPAVIEAVVAAYAGARGDGGGEVRQRGAPDQRPLAIIPTYGGRDGHPIVLDRALWPEVMAVRGDEGARSVIRAHPEAVWRLAVAGGAPPRDVDTPADYAALRSADDAGADVAAESRA